MMRVTAGWSIRRLVVGQEGMSSPGRTALALRPKTEIVHLRLGSLRPSRVLASLHQRAFSAEERVWGRLVSLASRATLMRQSAFDCFADFSGDLAKEDPA
jgi:hypothetical protein